MTGYLFDRWYFGQSMYVIFQYRHSAIHCLIPCVLVAKVIDMCLEMFLFSSDVWGANPHCIGSSSEKKTQLFSHAEVFLTVTTIWKPLIPFHLSYNSKGFLCIEKEWKCTYPWYSLQSIIWMVLVCRIEPINGRTPGLLCISKQAVRKVVE